MFFPTIPVSERPGGQPPGDPVKAPRLEGSLCPKSEQFHGGIQPYLCSSDGAVDVEWRRDGLHRPGAYTAH